MLIKKSRWAMRVCGAESADSCFMDIFPGHRGGATVLGGTCIKHFCTRWAQRSQLTGHTLYHISLACGKRAQLGFWRRPPKTNVREGRVLYGLLA